MDYTYSIIIPHHNDPDLLNRCLESIPVRDDIQLIIVDDNSLPALQPQVSRSNVETVSLNALQSCGAGHARNVGLKRARGKWLLFADSDDYYEPGFLDILDQYISSDADVIYFSYNIKDQADQPIEVRGSILLALRDYTLNKEQSDIVRFRNNSPWNKMVKREFILEKDIQFEEVPNGNDIYYSLQLGVYSSSYQFIPNKIYNYVIHPDSISTRKKSTEDAICITEHSIKKYAFNKAIGHPEWKISLYKIIYGLIKDHGIIFGVVVMSKIISRYLNGHFKPKEWVSIIPNQ